MTTLTKNQKIYEEFLDFIAQGTTPEKLTQFQFSPRTKEQIEDLVYRAKNGEITKEDKQELDELLLIEHLIMLTKAKAYQYLNSQSQEV
jgi:hypothetical protein